MSIMKNVLLISLLIFFLSGCSATGDFFVPPHPKSDFRAPEKTCIYIKDTGSPKFAMTGMAASAAIGFIVDRIADGVEEEAGRYKTSYSSRTTFSLFEEAPGNTFNPTLDSFELVRWIGKMAKEKTCSGIEELFDEKDKTRTVTEKSTQKEIVEQLLRKKEVENKVVLEEAMRISFNMHSKNYPIWEVTGDYILLGKTRAKVSEPQILVPWSWWLPLSKSSGKIDLNATLAIGGVITTKDGLKHSDFIKVDMPLGKKFELADEEGKFNKIDISDVTSGYFVIPGPKTKDDDKNVVPITLSLTINESDALGDLIGKGSKKISDNKQQIINFSLEKFGLPVENDKGGGDGVDSK
jgi:hypothetical protein